MGRNSVTELEDELAQRRDDNARLCTELEPRLHSETRRATAAASRES